MQVEEVVEQQVDVTMGQEAMPGEGLGQALTRLRPVVTRT
jgi:hypothetical protein